MAATVWKGYLTFGLISVPIRLFAAARGQTVSFNMLHGVCGTRIKQQLFCPHCQRVVERSEIVKGYERAKDSYVVVEPEELKKIAPPSAQNMDIIQFVKLEEVDPLYFETSYYALPEEPGRKAYTLLVQSLQRSNYAALAKLAMHNREYIVIVRPRASGLTLHTLYYQNELHELPEYGQPLQTEVAPQEVELAQRLVENLAAPFQPEKFKDEYQTQVMRLIESKAEGKEITEPSPRRLAPVVDLMEALKRSLAGVEGKPPAAGGEGVERKLPERAGVVGGEGQEKPARKRAPAKRKAG